MLAFTPINMCFFKKHVNITQKQIKPKLNTHKRWLEHENTILTIKQKSCSFLLDENVYTYICTYFVDFKVT